MAGQRNVGIAVDFSPCSQAAVHWASENLVRGGDRVVLVHAVSCYQIEQGVINLWERSGSPLIPLNELCTPNVCKQYAVEPDSETLKMLEQMASQKRVEVVAKVYYGDAKAKLLEAIERVPLDCLVVGSRGLSKLKRALLGSVSSHVVANALCPVTVVKK
ncbi:universal stress protein PHOS32-like [Zingiber officinale]|uniref:UspA domain-containing protein n=1 Tax=Zingiber officinale TaxID=94328 RepID=A0A8J5L380_ZINOF|nr:universal stress protein PHOS32-like [Zingiber officinale]KAG6504834.1 hypothetical protein ZIOFF_037182 [Zingiber officinale]